MTAAQKKLREATDAFLEAVDRRAAELNDDIDSADDLAAAQVAEFNEGREEIFSLRRSLGKLKDEQAEIPNKVTKADLDGDEDRQTELRERYAAVKSIIEKTEERFDELHARLAELVPNFSFSPFEAEGRLFRPTERIANAAHEEMSAIEKRVNQHLSDVTEEARTRHRERRGIKTAFSQRREFEIKTQRGA